MSHSWDYDAIVIGSGPGGEGAAMGLVKQGARVAVIERYHNVGGGCTHWGTIPSKALRHAVSRIIEFNQNPLYSDHSRLLRSSFADILNHADSVINQQTHMRQGFYERNHCEILQGNAHFVDEHTLAWNVTTAPSKRSPRRNSSSPAAPVRIIRLMSTFPTRAFTTAILFSACSTSPATSLSMVPG
ncbi:soluble pyridine nucleotide transhydrogenase [Raoultella ornithinolytica]|nr:soluble pyridine nucleotide transhydrogenase [Raoultella ornithinolytica]